MIDQATARAALAYVSPDCSREDWVRVGFALASEFGENGFDLFDDWSSGGSKYDKRSCRSNWRSICRGRVGAKRVTIGTLIALAKANGFKFERTEQDEQQLREERARRREQARAREAAERREREEAAQRAAMLSVQRWRAAARTGSSPYCIRKRLADPESIRFEPNGTILVPMLRYDRPREDALVGVQSIDARGRKLFARGTAKHGSACRLGCVVVGDPILVGEGYATAMTLRMAVARRLPVFVAFDAGNLAPVVEILQALHPQSPLLLCADDDFATRGNPGRKVADRLRRRRGVDTIYPVWPLGSRGRKDTDFNDLHAAAGLHVVARQLVAPLRHLGFTGALAVENRHAA